MNSALKNHATYINNKVDTNEISISQYISTDNILQNKQGIECATSLPIQGGKVTAFKKGDILLANIRPYLKKIWYAQFDGGCSADVLAIRANAETDSHFLFYALFRDDFFIHAMKGAKGTKMPRGDKAQIMEFKIPVFDLKTQQSIAAVLSTLDKKIALNKQINARLEEMAKILYDYWFVQFDFPDANGKPYKSSGGEMVFDETLKREIPKGWEVKSLGEIVNFKNGINYSSDDVGDSVSYIVNVRDVSNSSIFIHEDDLDIVNLQGDKLQAYQIKENTILVARSGNPGATRLLVNTNKLVVYCGFIIAAEPKESNLLNLLFWFLKNQEERISDISAGTVLKNVSQDVLKRGCIVIPDKFILNKFNEFNRNIFAEISSMIKQNHQLTQLRDFLLPMLMNGQVSVAE
ncbi:TPA: restriction endonuclease subunit S [Neisseria oralis]